MYVLTLIGAPGTSTLTPVMLNALAPHLAAAGAKVVATNWLCPGEACDLTFTDMTLATAVATARALLAEAPLDIFAQAVAGRRKAVFLADMESTIIAQEMLDELAAAAKLGPEIAEITARSMAGELDFNAALDERAALLKGLPAALLEQLGDVMTLNPGAATLVKTLRRAGTYCALVTGGFDIFAERIAALCGFDELRANHLITENDVVSGRVTRPILGPQGKLEALRDITGTKGLSVEDGCAVGDGANDLAMLEAAGLGVAYRAKPLLRQRIQPLLDHGNLTGILYLQGYRRADFVTD